jgi:hypothetical protein
MMPGEQNSLEKDRECADERAGSAPLSSATEPNPYGKAHPHFSLCAPAYIRRTQRSVRVRATI